MVAAVPLNCQPNLSQSEGGANAGWFEAGSFNSLANELDKSLTWLNELNHNIRHSLLHYKFL